MKNNIHQSFFPFCSLQFSLHLLLLHRSFEAATQDDVFEALTEQALEDGIELPRNMTVGDIMNGWTKQRGYLLISNILMSFHTKL